MEQSAASNACLLLLFLYALFILQCYLQLLAPQSAVLLCGAYVSCASHAGRSLAFKLFFVFLLECSELARSHAA